MNLFVRFVSGLVGGVIFGILSFVSVAAVFFGLGLCGTQQLTVGAFMGAAAGIVFGPPLVLFRANRRMAVLVQTIISTVAMLALQVSMIQRGTMYSSVDSALQGLAAAVAYVAIASALSALGISGVAQWIDTWTPAVNRANVAALPYGSERRFRL